MFNSRKVRRWREKGEEMEKGRLVGGRADGWMGDGWMGSEGGWVGEGREIGLAG